MSDGLGDWSIQAGDFATVADAAAVPQGIQIRLGLFLSECYLDEAAGVDWIDSILITNADPLVVRGLLTAAIAETPDVINVVGAQLIRLPNRDSSISYIVDTTYSTDPFTAQAAVP